MKRFFTILAMVAGSAAAFAALKAPVLTYPGNGSVVVDVNVRVIWNPALGGTVSGYEAQVSVDSLFTSPINLVVFGTSGKSSELDYNTKYYWRVRAKGSSGNFSPWSKEWSFTTFNDQFSGASPLTSGTAPQVTLRIDTIPGTADYVFQWDTDTLLGSPASGMSSHDASNFDAGKVKFTVKDLTFGQTYFWRVKVQHAKDASAWSATYSFTVSDVIQYGSQPDDNEVNVDPATLLTAVNTAGVNEYRFLIDDSPTFDPNSNYYSLITAYDKDFKGEIQVYTALLGFNKTFYWKIQGVNNAGASNWSSPRSMTTVKQVTLKNPVDGKIDFYTKDAVLEWEKIKGVEFYEVQYDTNGNFSTATTLMAEGESTTKVTVSFKHTAAPYHWRVRAMHTKDTSAWSSVFSFTTKPTGIEDYRVLSNTEIYPNPAHNVLYIEFNPRTEGFLNVELYNIVGEKVAFKTYNVGSGNQKIDYDISRYESGVYMMTLDFNGERVTRRVIIK